jgi:hypothetical protein
MIKRKRGGATPDRSADGRRAAPDDIQQPLVEQWRRQAAREKVSEI